jgi:hypothetical protein
MRVRGLVLFLLTVLPAAMFALQPVFPRTGFYASDGYADASFALGSVLKPLLLLWAVIWAWDTTRLFDRDNPIRPAWGRLRLGLGLLLGGQLILAFYQLVLHVPIPFPSPADFFFVVAYPLLVFALAAFIRAYEAAGFPTGRPGERRAIGAVTAALCLVAAFQLLGPVLAAEGPGLEKALNLVYPTLDFVLLVPTVILLRLSLRFGGPVRRIWLFLTLGFFFLCLGDVLFAYLETFGHLALDPLVDAMYLLSYGFLAGGALQQRSVLAD